MCSLCDLTSVTFLIPTLGGAYVMITLMIVALYWYGDHLQYQLLLTLSVRFVNRNITSHHRTVSGNDQDAWRNDHFIRGRPEEMKNMIRVKIKNKRPQFEFSSKNEFTAAYTGMRRDLPNFYIMPSSSLSASSTAAMARRATMCPSSPQLRSSPVVMGPADVEETTLSPLLPGLAGACEERCDSSPDEYEVRRQLDQLMARVREGAAKAKDGRPRHDHGPGQVLHKVTPDVVKPAPPATTDGMEFRLPFSPDSISSTNSLNAAMKSRIASGEMMKSAPPLLRRSRHLMGYRAKPLSTTKVAKKFQHTHQSKNVAGPFPVGDFVPSDFKPNSNIEPLDFTSYVDK